MLSGRLDRSKMLGCTISVTAMLMALSIIVPVYGSSTNSQEKSDTKQMPAASMDAYVTCAVYHRMMAGSFRRVRQMPALADIETEKMNDFITLAKTAGKAEFGDAEVETVFLEAWNYDLGRMETKINRNYENVSRLTYIFKNKCRKLVE